MMTFDDEITYTYDDDDDEDGDRDGPGIMVRPDTRPRCEHHVVYPLENCASCLRAALDDTRDAVTRIRTDLPQDIQEPVISKVDIGGSLMTYALVAPHMTTDEASWFVDRDISRAMYGVPGVARVTRVGGVQRQVRVDLDPNALIAMGITAGDVSQQLARIQVERAGGKTEVEGAQQTIRTLGTVGDAQALRDYSIALPDGRAVRLSTLATVTDGAADPTEAALLDGKGVVAFSMSRTRGSS
jgi:multidrug efflux pump subunit AcrB